jgi:CheY-like chemotaxis protein
MLVSFTMKPRRILIADDNRDSADSLAVLLRMDGFEVAVAYDGTAALATIHEQRPQAALLDIGMPGMTGYEVARNARKALPKEALKLIAITGWGQHQDVARALEAGFDRHFTKPVDPTLLTKILG